MTLSGFVKTWFSFGLSLLVAVGASIADLFFPDVRPLTAHGPGLLRVIGMLAAVWCLGSVFTLLTVVMFQRQGRPVSEGLMIGRLYRLLSIIGMILVLAYGFGRLGTFGTLFSMFGGMLLGWSLQAPVSGFAAWLLVSIKRPFRPGDRVQFPSLGLTGDVQEIGPMYVMLDQVGGAVGSEEAVGRYILVPNAMLFSQVVINYTIKQEAAYMLDEVVVRITYDSDMQKAEAILLGAARKITGEIIAATGHEPYIRSDLYDYGVYLRLRFHTHVQDRARIAYELNKEIITEIRRTPEVDLAIPFIYSYRAGMAEMDRLEAAGNGKPAPLPQGIGTMKKS
jgi:small-conductance mechanosensitive channel